MDEIAKAVMDELWPALGGNHTDAEMWQSVNDAVRRGLEAALGAKP